MKVIFLKDVPKVGKKHEVKEVADGFAYNNLIPRKFAVPATPEHVREADAEKASVAHSREVKEASAREVAKKSKETPVRIEVSTNEKGHLFQGLRAVDVVKAIHTAYGISLEEKDIVLTVPIKEAGSYEIALRSGDFEGVCSVVIETKKK